MFCTTTTLFCTTKPSTFLVTHYFYGGIVVCAYPIFCFLCSCSLLFFTGPHLHLADCSVLAASNSHFLTVSLNFHVFLPTKFVSLALALSLLSTWVWTSIITSKKTRLCCCFFFLKVRVARRFSSKWNLELHLSYGWIHVRAGWSESCVLISYQWAASKMEASFPAFFPREKILSFRLAHQTSLVNNANVNISSIWYTYSLHLSSLSFPS